MSVDVKISQLPDKTTRNLADYVPMVDTDNVALRTVRQTLSVLLNYGTGAGQTPQLDSGGFLLPGVVPAATTVAQGAVTLATSTSVQAGTSTTVVVTPGALYTAGVRLRANGSNNPGALDLSGGAGAGGGSITTSNGGGSLDTTGTGSLQLGVVATRTTLTGSATAARTIAFPDASGTVALTSSLSGFLSSVGGDFTGTAGAGYLGLPTQSATPGVITAGTRIFANSSGQLSWRSSGADNSVRSFGGTLTTDRSYAMPDLDGTLALTTGAQTFTGKSISGSTNTLTNVSLTSSVTGTLPVGNGGTNVTTFGGTNTVLYTTAADTLAAATAGNNGVLITSGVGVPSVSSTLPAAVQSNITGLGVVVTGTWSATTIGTTAGGTGLTSYALGDTLYSSATNVLSKVTGNTTAVAKALMQTGNGTISAAPAWVAIPTSITGTSGQITASAATGSVTLSIPTTLTGVTSITGVNTITSSASNNLVLAAGATNQSIVLTPSGTGTTYVSTGLFGIGKIPTEAYLDVLTPTITGTQTIPGTNTLGAAVRITTTLAPNTNDGKTAFGLLIDTVGSGSSFNGIDGFASHVSAGYTGAAVTKASDGHNLSAGTNGFDPGGESSNMGGFFLCDGTGLWNTGSWDQAANGTIGNIGHFAKAAGSASGNLNTNVGSFSYVDSGVSLVSYYGQIGAYDTLANQRLALGIQTSFPLGANKIYSVYVSDLTHYASSTFTHFIARTGGSVSPTTVFQLDYDGTISTGIWGGTAISNAKLANSAITIGGASTSLGGAVTASTILDSLSSTQGAVVYRSASGWVALTAGTAGNVLTTQGAGANPTWSPASGGTVVNSITGTSGQIAASASTGAVTLSLPATLTQAQTFSGVTTISNATAGVANGSSGALLVTGGICTANSLRVSNTTASAVLASFLQTNGNVGMTVVMGSSNLPVISFKDTGAGEVSTIGTNGVYGNMTGRWVVNGGLATSVTLLAINPNNGSFTGKYFSVQDNSAVDQTYITNAFGLVVGAATEATTGGAGSIVAAGGVYVTKKIITASTLTTLGGATLHTTSSALTDGAGASTGTLTNAPSVGNPTKWIGINDNGTTRYVPAW